MKRPRWITADGLHMRVGGPLWKWWRRNKGSLQGNPALNRPPAHTALEEAKRVVAFAHLGLAFAGQMTYSEGSDRSQLFHRAAGQFAGAHADCSQFVSSILHWVGVKTVTDTDYTGTLLQKGKPLAKPQPGCVAVWGPGAGVHTALVSEKAGTNDWWCIGFGHQGAPDRVTLSNLNAYFDRIGQPGVRFLNFL